jgi:hypothetical protein
VSEADAAEKPKSRARAKPAKSGKVRNPRGGPEHTRFKPGQSGNPAGPKPGYRQEFSRAFVADIAKHFAKVGDKAIEKVYRENPLGYLRVCASLVDQEINVKTPFSHLDHLTDDQLRASIAELNERVLHALAAAGGNVPRAAASSEPQQAGKLPALLKAT